MNDYINRVTFGDCRETMRDMIESGIRVQTCVTSPPYYGLRDYGVPGQIGAERNHIEYVQNMLEVFELVRDLLEDNGTLWLNLGDTYSRGPNRGPSSIGGTSDGCSGRGGRPAQRAGPLDDKQLLGIPWEVALALRNSGWYLRADIIWSKPNPMPESVQDRPSKSHEYIFLLAKSARYYYDGESIKEPPQESTIRRWGQDIENQQGSTRANGGVRPDRPIKPVGGPHLAYKKRGHPRAHEGFRDKWDRMTKAEQQAMGRNKRTVWEVATKSYSGAHFATFPPELIKPCIIAGSPPGGIVLDPFMGSGTTAEVAQSLGRQWIGCELNPEYAALQRERIRQTGLAV